ncbi:MAG: primosomal protein N' [Alkalilacustris sp.]
MAEVFGPGERVAVLTTEPVGVLDYRAPEGGLRVGAFVDCPLGPRRVAGVVWGAGESDFPLDRLRPILRQLDAPPMRGELRDFLTRAAAYTLTPLPAMLRLATRAPGLWEGPATRRILHRAGPEPARMTPARTRVMDVLEAHGAGLTAAELATEAGVSTGVVRGLIEAGTLVETLAPRDAPFPRLDPARPGPGLTEDQAAGAAQLRAAIAAGGYGTTLIQGVTGSGKTEVYLEAVAEALARGTQALVLLPEIALTAEFLARVEARFGARPAEWHSGATAAERRRVWQAVARGGAGLTVGARSALFLPFERLGLIVVDEEHDGSYKQEEGVLYNARDMAVLRASLAGAQVVLSSATPSLESWVNAETGKYTRIRLSSRFGPAELPDMRALDLRAEQLETNRWISPTLARAVAARLEAGQQSLLFLNRRGYAPVTVCRACGEQVGCADCDARMVEHRFLRRLVCHQCGATRPIPDTCPACGAEGRMAPIGPGVERLAEEVAERFPTARTAVLSSDLFTTARALKSRITEIAEGGADIIIGTQLVAKGHNFPALTLVGVIDADLGLQGSDLRAAERTFQLIRQVAGRAGRGARRGVALVQTTQPDHPVIQAILADDDEGFWRAEAASRRALGMPPFGRLAGVILSSPDLDGLHDFALALAREDAPLRAIGAELYGPAPAPIARIRGRHRIRMLIKADRRAPLQQALAQWSTTLKPPANLRLSIDIDPQSFF